MTGKKRGKKMKAVKAWGGFTDGKLDTRDIFLNGSWLKVSAVFPAKWIAAQGYQDVRRIEIREIPAARRK